MADILRTGQQARHPWPEGILIQGGKSGLAYRDGKGYTTAFVEVGLDRTFLRGEGKTVAEAEDSCWAKYQRLTACPAHPDHGPFEPRDYTNGAGFCTQCGGWFSGVCEPSLEHRIAEVAYGRVEARYGREVVFLPQWKGLVADEKAQIRAMLNGGPPPGPTTEPPVPEDLRRATEPFDPAVVTELLTALSERVKADGEEVSRG